MKPAGTAEDMNPLEGTGLGVQARQGRHVIADPLTFESGDVVEDERLGQDREGLAEVEHPHGGRQPHRRPSSVALTSAHVAAMSPVVSSKQALSRAIRMAASRPSSGWARALRAFAYRRAPAWAVLILRTDGAGASATKRTKKIASRTAAVSRIPPARASVATWNPREETSVLAGNG